MTKDGTASNCDCKCHPTEMAGAGKTDVKACCNGFHCPWTCPCCAVMQAENSDRVKAEKRVTDLELQNQELRKAISDALPFMRARHAWKPTKPHADAIRALEEVAEKRVGPFKIEHPVIETIIWPVRCTCKTPPTDPIARCPEHGGMSSYKCGACIDHLKQFTTPAPDKRNCGV